MARRVGTSSSAIRVRIGRGSFIVEPQGDLDLDRRARRTRIHTERVRGAVQGPESPLHVAETEAEAARPVHVPAPRILDHDPEARVAALHQDLHSPGARIEIEPVADRVFDERLEQKERHLRRLEARLDPDVRDESFNEAGSLNVGVGRYERSLSRPPGTLS
jgi:hypothetical protein